MNITSESILERLRNGETAEDIANEMIASLNKAIKVQEDEAEAARKAEEAAKAKAKQEEKLNTLATAIAGAVGEYMKLSMPEYAEEMTMPTTEEVRETLDRSIKFLTSLGPALERLIEANPFEVKVDTMPKVVDTTDPITKFLRDNRLL